MGENSDKAKKVLGQNQAAAKEETLVSWLLSVGKAGVKSLPKKAAAIAIRIAVAVSFQFVFWWDTVSRFIPDFIKMPVIFLTATYNDVVPKTLFWVILFTFGEKLLKRIRETGFMKAMRPIMWLIPEFKKTYQRLREKAYSLLLIGGGIGLIVANNFASYSRFSGARNKFDKYFIALVISFTISYLLGEGRKHWLFKFSRLASSDFSRLFKVENKITDDHTYMALSGFVAGLLLDAPLILMHLMYGGYFAGAVLIIGAIALNVMASSRRK